MKLTNHQIESMVRRILLGLEKKSLIQFTGGREKALARGQEIIAKDYEKEAELDKEIHRMMDDIERDQTDQFERHRMFKMLKKKVAGERGIVL